MLRNQIFRCNCISSFLNFSTCKRSQNITLTFKTFKKSGAVFQNLSKQFNGVGRTISKVMKNINVMIQRMTTSYIEIVKYSFQSSSLPFYTDGKESESVLNLLFYLKSCMQRQRVNGPNLRMFCNSK